MSKRDDLIRLHKAAVTAVRELECSLSKGTTMEHVNKYKAWRDAENTFMRVAETVKENE